MIESDIEGVANCRVHADRDSVDECAVCEQAFCAECMVIFEGADLCRTCLSRREQEMRFELEDTTRKLGNIVSGSDASRDSMERRIATLGRLIEKAKTLQA